MPISSSLCGKFYLWFIFPSDCTPPIADLTLSSGAGLFEYKLIPMLLDLFVKYPFNNNLHNLVLRAVLFILKSELEGLMKHLYQDCKFASWLCLAPEEIEHPTGTGLLDPCPLHE